MLFNEPKLLKFCFRRKRALRGRGFSALQRAEIAEIKRGAWSVRCSDGFSALQRAEIAEIDVQRVAPEVEPSFSALQRAEIAEIAASGADGLLAAQVSVLFNEPKLLKSCKRGVYFCKQQSFSALQRAEIAEIVLRIALPKLNRRFQCSSTSRNC